MARWIRLVLGGLVGAVIIAALYFPILKRRVTQTAKVVLQSEEQARRELTQPLAANPSEPRVKAKLFWASNADDAALTPVTVDLPLSADPVLRPFTQWFAGHRFSLHDEHGDAAAAALAGSGDVRA